MTAAKRAFAFALSAMMLGGCGAPSKVDDLLSGRKVDYGRTESQRSQALRYPPDLKSVGEEEGDVSLSEYRLDKVPLAADVAPTDVSARVIYRRNGNLRWLTVEQEPGKVWVRVRAFFADEMGFSLAEEKPGLGVMETIWLDLRSAPPGTGLSALLDNVLERVYDSGERDKFRVRFEENDGGGTDVYITHRYSIARFTQENPQGTAIFKGFEPQASNPELEVEMLRRLMLYFAGLSADDKEKENENKDELDTKSVREIDEEIAAAEQDANTDYLLESDRLIIRKPLKDTWPLIFVGLDRGGFSVEDRDFIERAFYIRHSGEGVGKQEDEGFFNKLFTSDAPEVRALKLSLAPVEGDVSRTAVTVAANDDNGELSEAEARAFLDLLLKNLP